MHRLFPHLEKRAFLEYKRKFKLLSQEEKTKRARQLWKVARTKLKIIASLRNTSQGAADDLEDDDKLQKEIAWYLLDPRTSRIHKTWFVIMTFVYWIDILSTPIRIIWPHYVNSMIGVVYICDVAWIINMGVNFITIRLDMDSRDPVDIAKQYIKRLFVIDLIATLPPMIFDHDPSIRLVRVLHLFYWEIIMSPLQTLLVLMFP